MSFGRKNGYKTYTDRYGRQRFVHVRVMEKKLGGRIRRGGVVHHIDGDKDNNRPVNLTVVSPGVHGRLHGRSPHACLRCGRNGHWANACDEWTDYAGKPL